jgi:Flp pilus assembly protein TadG
MLCAHSSRFSAPPAATGLRRLKQERGGALVEYALVFMLLMTMLLGIVDFCRALYAYHFVSNMAREATRWAIVNGADCGADGSCNGTSPMNNGPATPTNIQSYVTSHAPLGIDPTKLTTNVTQNPAGTNAPPICATTPNAAGCTVEVKITYQFSFLFSFVHTGALPLSSTSEMVIAH